MTREELAHIVRAERNAYAKAWRAKNRDKVAAINRRYWEKRALRAMERIEAKGGEADD